jgi:hypothetical protein
VSFSAKEFWAAAEKAVRGVPLVEVQPLDRQSRFRVRKNQGGGLTLAFAPDQGPAFGLDEPALALLDRDPRIRRRNLLDHPNWFDLAWGDYSREVERIVQEPQAWKRIDRMQHHRSRSAAYFYEQLREKRDRGHGLSLSDFEAPAAHGLLRHLRLPQPPAPGELPRRLEKAADDLVREFGFIEAFRRLASLPIAMPQILLQLYARLAPEEKERSLQKLETLLLSPSGRVHLAGLVAPTDVDRAIAIGTDFALEEKGQRFAGFVLLLSWSLEQLGERKETKNWPFEATLAAAWVHASNLYSILAPVSEAESMAKFFLSARGGGRRDIFRAGDRREEDVAHPLRLRRRTFFAYGLAAGTKALPEGEAVGQVRAALLELCLISDGEQAFLHPEFVSSPKWQRDVLGSFLGQYGSKALEERLGAAAAAVSSDFVLQLGIVAANELKKSPVADPKNWRVLSGMLGGARAPESLYEVIGSVLIDQRIPELAKLQLGDLEVVIHFLVQQAGNYSDRYGEFAGLFAKLAQNLSLTVEAGEARKKAAELMVEAARTLSCAQGPTRPEHEFSRLVMSIKRAAPSFGDEIWQIMRALPWRLSLHSGEELWESILTLRMR